MSNTFFHQRIFVARHGQTEWSHDGRYQGRSDPPLSPEGIVESQRLAETLRGMRIGAIITSPLQRARQTAAIIVNLLELDPAAIDPNLAEISYGAWEGLTQSEVKSRWPELLRRWKRTPETVRFPGGETLDEARSRVCACLTARRQHTGSMPILLVTHAAWIRLALIEAFGLSLADFRHITIETGSVHQISIGLSNQFSQPTEQVSCVSR